MRFPVAALLSHSRNPSAVSAFGAVWSGLASESEYCRGSRTGRAQSGRSASVRSSLVFWLRRSTRNLRLIELWYARAGLGEVLATRGCRTSKDFRRAEKRIL